MNRRTLIVCYVMLGTAAFSFLDCSPSPNCAAAEPDLETALKEAHTVNSAALGKNILVVRSGSQKPLFGQTVPITLTIEDADAIAKQCPSVLAAAPILSFTAKAEFTNRNWVSARDHGTTPSYLVVRDWQISAGRNISKEDVLNGNAVCVVGLTVAQELFGGVDPMGQEIQISGSPFRVIGILDKKGEDNMEMDQDDTILIPLSTANKIKSSTPSGYVDWIWIKALTTEKMLTANHEVEKILRDRHHIADSEKDDFYIEDLLKSREDAISESHKSQVMHDLWEKKGANKVKDQH